MGKRRVTHSSILTKLTVFTQEPPDYAGVKVEGPFKGGDNRF